MTTQQRFIDVISTETGKEMSATKLGKWLGVDRSYVYDLARKNDVERINGVWVTNADVQAKADMQYQMLSEMHDVIVNGKDTRGRVHIELPKPFEVVDGQTLVPIARDRPLTGDWNNIEQRVAEATDPDKLKKLISIFTGGVMYRVNELDKD